MATEEGIRREQRIEEAARVCAQKATAAWKRYQLNQEQQRELEFEFAVAMD